MNIQNSSDLTSSGMVYSYNLPREYKGTSTTSRSCYINSENYTGCKLNPIVPPTPSTSLPKIFLNNLPHPMPQNNINYSSNDYQPSNRNYYNKVLYGSSNQHNYLANANTNGNYRVISMPNSYMSCGGLGYEFQQNKFKPGFNDVSHQNYYP